MRGRRAAPLFLILAGAATAAPAQDTVSLRLQPPVGQVTPYHTDLAAWIVSPMMPPTDSTTPTVTLKWDLHRRVEASGPAGATWLDVVDSSALDMPAMRAANPQFALGGDVLRGLTSRTRVTDTGREIATDVVAAPALPTALPLLLRGIVSLAMTSSRLTTFAVPDHAVRPGETWTDSVTYATPPQTELAGSVLSGGGMAVGTFRLERLERRPGGRVAIISVTATVDAAALDPAAAATMHFTGTARFDLDLDGTRLARAEVALEGSMQTRYGAVPTRIRIVRRIS